MKNPRISNCVGKLMLAVSTALVSQGTAQLFKEDFETQTLRDNPQAARSTPSTPEILGDPVPIPPGVEGDEFDEDRYAIVIDDIGTVDADGIQKFNLAGTGNGLEIFDLKQTTGTFSTGGNTAVEWQIVPSTVDEVSTLECSFDFVWQNEFAANHIFFAIGLFEPRPGHTSHNFGSKNERDVEVRFGGDGGIRIGTASPLFQCVDDQKYTFTVFVNDNDTEQVIYEDPMGTVRLADTNSVYMFVDGNFIGSTPYLDVRDNPAGTLRAGDSNIGRIGFVTATNEEGGIMQIDNICAAEIAPSTGTPILFKDDFESSTVGNAPSADGPQGFTVVTGAANVAGGGAGNGVRQYDDADSTTIAPPSPLSSDYQVDLPKVGNLHIQFDVAWNDISDGMTDLGLAKVRIGQAGNGMTSGTRSYFDLGFSGLGEVRFDSSESVTPPAPQQLTSGTPAHIDMFVNDNDTESVDYPSPAGGVGTLPAESWAVYIDGVFMGVDGFDTNVVSDAPAAPGTAGENLGRFGIVSATNDLNIDYTWDNFCITTIPSVSVDLPQPEKVVISVASNITQLTFDSIEGNLYEISQTDDIGTIPFAVIGFVEAGAGGETTYTRIGALEDKEFFRVENTGPAAP
ncbi:hypothetical protein [Haloferula sp.]|uniref:hypothetical protein n=1 Tax=Haloferula sp. TaxID=2497595 RepID=UPI00329FC6DD